LHDQKASQIWLATWTPSAFPKPEAGDRKNIIRWMRMKYEEKRWYRSEEEIGAEPASATEEKV